MFHKIFITDTFTNIEPYYHVVLLSVYLQTTRNRHELALLPHAFIIYTYKNRPITTLQQVTVTIETVIIIETSYNN